jgi:hypothetical protein
MYFITLYYTALHLPVRCVVLCCVVLCCVVLCCVVLCCVVLCCVVLCCVVLYDLSCLGRTSWGRILPAAYTTWYFQNSRNSGTFENAPFEDPNLKGGPYLSKFGTLASWGQKRNVAPFCRLIRKYALIALEIVSFSMLYSTEVFPYFTILCAYSCLHELCDGQNLFYHVIIF